MTLEKAGWLRRKSVQTLHHSSTASCSAVAEAGRPFIEKRREARYVTCDVVEVCILHAEGERLQGILRDVSRSGLRIELSLPVNIGARLEVVLHNRAIIFGEARYCAASAHAYQVGVVIEDIYYPKSQDAFSSNMRRAPYSPRPGSDREIGGCSIAQGLRGTHASPDDVAAFLHHDLSETKTALMERHLAACEECSSLMHLMLEDYQSFVSRLGKTTTQV
jgi:hypothetical protein